MYKHYFLILVKALLISINYQSCIQIRRTFGSKTLQKQPYPDIMPWEWTSLNSMRPFRKHRQNTCKEQQRYSCRQSISSLDQITCFKGKWNRNLQSYLRKYESPRNRAVFWIYSRNPNTIPFIAMRNVPKLYNLFVPIFAPYAANIGDEAKAARLKMPNTKPY